MKLTVGMKVDSFDLDSTGCATYRCFWGDENRISSKLGKGFLERDLAAFGELQGLISEPFIVHGSTVVWVNGLHAASATLNGLAGRMLPSVASSHVRFHLEFSREVGRPTSVQPQLNLASDSTGRQERQLSAPSILRCLSPSRPEARRPAG